MTDDPKKTIAELPAEAFQEPAEPLLQLSYLQRLRWLQQTAYFIWKYGGAAQSQVSRSENNDKLK